MRTVSTRQPTSRVSRKVNQPDSHRSDTVLPECPLQKKIRRSEDSLAKLEVNFVKDITIFTTQVSGLLRGEIGCKAMHNFSVFLSDMSKRNDYLLLLFFHSLITEVSCLVRDKDLI